MGSQIVQVQILNLRHPAGQQEVIRDPLRRDREHAGIRLGLTLDDRQGVAQQRDALIVASLLARVFPISDRQKSSVSVDVSPLHPHDLATPHARGDRKVDDVAQQWLCGFAHCGQLVRRWAPLTWRACAN